MFKMEKQLFTLQETFLIKATNATIEVFNSFQKLFTNQTVYLTPGQNLININLEQLPSGIYFLRLKKGDDEMMKKMVKD